MMVDCSIQIERKNDTFKKHFKIYIIFVISIANGGL